MKEGDNKVRVREISEDAVLLALKMKEEHMSQGMQDACKAEKGKETHSSPRACRSVAPHTISDLSPAEL